MGTGSAAQPSLVDQLKALAASGIKDAAKALKKGWKALTGLNAFQRWLRGSGTWLQDFTFLSKSLGPDEAIKALGRIGPMTLAEAKASRAGPPTRRSACPPPVDWRHDA